MQINAIESSSNWDLVLVMRPCACVCARATQMCTVSVYKFTCFIQKLCYTSTILILYVYSILILKIPTRIRNETNKHKKQQRQQNSYARNGQNECIERGMFE